MKKRSKRKRLVILDEAYASFRGMSFEKKSVGEINARVVGSMATIDSYFRSKEDREPSETIGAI